MLVAARGVAFDAQPRTAGADAGRTVVLTILHTSDLHGHVDAHDELADRDWGEGLARVSTAVRAVRSEARAVLLLDSGDTIQGSPMQSVAFGKGAGASDPTIRAMNALEYDAMTVGNHEYDFGLARLEASRKQARFPFLSANVVKEDGSPAFTPYLVRVIAGARVGILGLTTKNVPGWEPPRNIAGTRFLDTVETARRLVPVLRGKERCDVVVVLTHQGFERDLATGKETGTNEENQAYAIATEVPGIDILLTGHTHSVIAPQRLGSAWVSQPGRFGNTLTRFDVKLERQAGANAKGWAIASIEGRNLPMKDVAPDQELARLVATEHAAAMGALSATIGSLTSAASVRDARTADNGVLDWLHDVQRREGHADLSFASLLPGSLPPWAAGPFTLRQVWSFYPYENTLVTVRATGRQVREALEDAALCVSGIGSQDGQPVWKRNPAVWGYNCDTMDGAQYAFDPTRPEGKRLVYFKRAGKDVSDDETFTVAINSYRASGGGGYAVWRACPRVEESGKGLRELLVEDARRRGTLDFHADGNWFLTPTLPEGKFGEAN